MSNYNRYASSGNSSFPFEFAPSGRSPHEFPMIWEGRPPAIPLRATKSSNALPLPSSRNKPETQNLRPYPTAEFQFTAPRSSVDSSNLYQSNLHGYNPGPRITQTGFTTDLQASLPIHTFLNESGPWVAPESLPQPGVSAVPSHFPGSNYHYRSGPQSEVESIATGPCQSDSGYASQPTTTQSRGSGEVPGYSPDFSDLTTPLHSLDLAPMPAKSPDASQVKPEDRSSKSPTRNRGGKKKCDVCDKILNCPSDHRKHMLKHEKPHKCDIRGCPRGEGFSTINDLNRHKKSVHKIGVDSITRSFKCASPGCKNHEKIWPRLDNFKQHIVRMHKNDDVEDLITRSELKGPVTSADPNSGSIDRDLAGIDSVSKYGEPAPFTVDPEELQRGIFGQLQQTPDPLRLHPNHSDVSLGFGNRNPGTSLGRIPSPQRPSGSTSFNGARARSPSKEKLFALADIADTATALTDPMVGLVPTHSQMQSSRMIPHATSPTTNLHSIEERKVPEELDLLDEIKRIGKKFSSVSEEVKAKMIASLSANEIHGNGTAKKGSHSRNSLSGHSSSFDGRSQRNGAVDVHSASSSEQEEAAQSLEVARGLAIIASLAKKQRQKSPGSSPDLPRYKNPEGVECQRCKKKLPRNCDLNKHMKRHTKPWGCTFVKTRKACAKVFGSKNDWTRHERDQHFQEVLWFCQIPKASARHGKCAFVCYEETDFTQHLNKVHEVFDSTESTEVESISGDCRIGHRHHPRYWCGFCIQVRPLNPPPGPVGWDNHNHRFDHIDKHFKEGRKIEEWVDCETSKTIAELLEEHDKANSSAKGTFSNSLNSQNGQDRPDSNTPQLVVTSSEPNTRHGLGLESSRKRKYSGEHGGRPQKSPNRHVSWTCCQCNAGPTLVLLYGKCVNMTECEHERCANCSVDDTYPSPASRVLSSRPPGSARALALNGT